MKPWWESWWAQGLSMGWETVTVALPSLGFLPALRSDSVWIIGLSPDLAPPVDWFQLQWEEVWGKPVVLWQDQWEKHPMVVLSKMQHLKGKSRRIPARVCQFMPISADVYRAFLEQFHLFGSAKAAFRYGLYLPESYRRFLPENEPTKAGPFLVSVGGFSKIQLWERAHGPSRSMEWIRFASLPNYHVIGGWKKMLTHVHGLHQPDDIMTYADRGWQGNSQGLASLGFALDSYLPSLRFRWDVSRGRRVLDESGELYNIGTEKWIHYFHPPS